MSKEKEKGGNTGCLLFALAYAALLTVDFIAKPNDFKDFIYQLVIPTCIFAVLALLSYIYSAITR